MSAWRALWVGGLVLVVLLVSGDADARRRRRGRAKRVEPPRVAVVPFESKSAAIKKKLAKSIELELELVDDIRVIRGRKLGADLRKKRKAWNDPATLAKLLKKRKTNLVIRGVQGWSEEGKEAVHIVVYAGDGEARLQRTFPLPDDVDEAAQSLVEELGPKLAKAAKLPALKPVFPPKPKVVTDADLFVDLEGDKRSSAKKRSDAKKRKSKVLDEIRAEKRRKYGDDDDGDGDGDKKRAKASTKRSSGSDDGPRRIAGGEPAPEGSPPDRLDGGEETSAGDNDPEKAMADGEEPDDDEDGLKPDLSHLILISGGVEGGLWFYNFLANKPAQGNAYPFYKLFPGGQIRLAFFPIEWVGADFEARAQVLRFQLADSVPVEPQTFFGAKTSVAIAARARYILHLGPVGLGGGVRAGYRYRGVFVPEQLSDVDRDLLTLVPGMHGHFLPVGPELFFSAVVLDRRIEAEVFTEFSPVSFNFEVPDSPGQYTTTYAAWNLAAAVRAEIWFGAFAELSAYHFGVVTNWDETGTRRGQLIDAQTGQRERVRGGLVVNIDAGAQLGGGWSW